MTNHHLKPSYALFFTLIAIPSCLLGSVFVFPSLSHLLCPLTCLITPPAAILAFIVLYRLEI